MEPVFAVRPALCQAMEMRQGHGGSLQQGAYLRLVIRFLCPQTSHPGTRPASLPQRGTQSFSLGETSQDIEISY